MVANRPYAFRMTLGTKQVFHNRKGINHVIRFPAVYDPQQKHSWSLQSRNRHTLKTKMPPRDYAAEKGWIIVFSPFTDSTFLHRFVSKCFKSLDRKEMFTKHALRFWLVLLRKPCICDNFWCFKCIEWPCICDNFWCVKCKVLHFYVKTRSKASWIVKQK